MLGRSKPVTKVRPGREPFSSLPAMSRRVASSAVAVKAARGTPGKRAGTRASASYSGRNDGPQREMQRSEEHTSELQSLMRNSYAVFCLKQKTQKTGHTD